MRLMSTVSPLAAICSLIFSHSILHTAPSQHHKLLKTTQLSCFRCNNVASLVSEIEISYHKTDKGERNYIIFGVGKGLNDTALQI